ncbi:PD-(D/E)XK nuclease family protein [Candidatus Woesearchaeota archaeon]|nr:PD-(D/E)XK nuclease family protein [Candidatus Woesearchaeota archaeon]
MTTYSHSKLGTFQQCKFKYKLQYIDRIKVELEGIEAFMGKRVHETLEKLYKDLKFQKLNSKKELLAFYSQQWDKEWHDEVIIAKKEYTAANYKEMGRKFVSDYYEHYKPFKQLVTLGLETQDRLELADDIQYHVRIDRFACDKDGNYYICDYKTNNSLKAQEELDEDRQLAMYSLWVRKTYPDAKSVKLVWYFLAFDKEMVSERNEEQLSALKQDTLALIKEIESCKDFPTNVSALCDYCPYKPQCPAWKHEIELEAKSPKEFKDDDGLKLVDEYSLLDETRKRAESKMEEIKEKLVEFSEQKGINMIWGTEKKASVKEYYKVVFPEDKEEIVRLIKQKGIYEDVSSVNYLILGPKILKNQVPSEIIDKVKTEKAHRVSVSKR